MNLRNIVESIEDELRNYQFQDFDRNSNWKSGIDWSNFTSNVVPRISVGQTYIFIYYKDNTPFQIDTPHPDRIRIFKNMTDAKIFVQNFNKFQIFESAELAEYSNPNIIDSIYPIPHGFDAVLLEGIFKKRYDTFLIEDKLSYDKFMKIWSKFGNTNKLKITRISLKKDISNKF